MIVSHLLHLMGFVGSSDAAPQASRHELVQQLQPRQIISANPTVECCTNCQDKYSTSDFQATFDNLCNWAGSSLDFTGPGTYYSGNYYCPSPLNSAVCMHLIIEYSCDEPQHVTYEGCLGYFDFVIDPPDTCGGSPFPGAQVKSAGGCWVFQATADLLSQWDDDVKVEDLQCDSSGHWCTLPGSNTTADTYNGPAHMFGSMKHR